MSMPPFDRYVGVPGESTHARITLSISPGRQVRSNRASHAALPPSSATPGGDSEVASAPEGVEAPVAARLPSNARASALELPGGRRVDHEDEAGLRSELGGLEVEIEVPPDVRVVELLDAGAMGADVVCRPVPTELVALRRELADQLLEGLVVGRVRSS